MALRCSLCDEAFEAHLVVEARSRKHWRGPSFDAEQARGDVGLALLETLEGPGGDLDGFLATVRVEAFREDPAGAAPWRGEADRDDEEAWAFHAGFRRPLSPEEERAARDAMEAALASARGFLAPRWVEAPDAVTMVEEALEDAGSVEVWRNPALDPKG